MALKATIALPVALAAGILTALATTSPTITAAADPTASLTKRQLAGQMVVYSYLGPAPPRALKVRIARGEVGGVILFTRNIAGRARLRAAMASLQRADARSGLPGRLPVMIDQEGGLVKRLSGAPSHSAAAIGRIGRNSLARSEGMATGRNLRSVGVNVNLAPVLDVGRPGSFQRRTERSYGSDPTLVGRLGAAFVQGLQSGGAAATLKHFPGIGTVRNDEDLRAQKVRLTREQIRSTDEPPFARGMAAGSRLVMTSTAIYPAFDNAPALLSKVLSTDELRGRLGFRGVVITDDLEVPAMRRYGSPSQLALRATRAGNDLLLFAQSYSSAVAGAAAVMRSIDEARLRDSVGRVLALRRAIG